MTTQACLDKIAQEPPPLNSQCPTICVQDRFINGTHCSTLGLPVDTPFITFDPNPAPGKYCYCCCSCFTAGTPIEKTPGTFILVQDIEAGDHILAAGTDLHWKPSLVKERSGATKSSDISGLYLIFYRLKGEDEPRRVLATPGHLFLMARTRRFQSVQHLVPGDLLAQADGGEAEVIFGMRSQEPIPTSVHTLRMDGDFDGKDTTGHLLNTNGVVTADYAVQVYFAATEDNDHGMALGAAGPPMEIGSHEYVAAYHTPEMFETVQAVLPAGFKPEATHQQLLQIPATASRYLTDGEASRLTARATSTTLSNFVPQIAAQRVIGLIRGAFPDVVFLIDWRSDAPNVYAFSDGGQKFVVVTGGFLRLDAIHADLVMLALASMAARQSGSACVCESDYQAVAYTLRLILTDDTFVHIISRALEQATALFALIGDDGAERTAGRRCADPGLDCRQKTLASALSFQGVPDCGQPPAPGLALVGARLGSSGTSLQVTFNGAVEVRSAQAAGNYALTPAGHVSAAAVSPKDPAVVQLTVSGIDEKGPSVLTVGRVISQSNIALLPGSDRVLVTTL